MIESSRPWSPYDLVAFIISFIEGYLVNNKRKYLLDTGCGFGKWGYLIRTSPPYKGLSDHFLIGCDVYLPNIRWVKSHRVYDDVMLCDVRFLPLREKSVDLILACELIEHLMKKEGHLFLDDLETIYRYAIIITTPGIYYEPIPSMDVEGGKATPFDLHRSLWSANDFRKRGYQVLGIGTKFATIHYLRELDLPTRLKFFIKIILSSFSFLRADLGEMMVAVKIRRDLVTK